MDLSCPPTTLLYLLCFTNMLPSSTNSPGASLHQTHGLLLPSVHFGPPSAMLKTSGNVLTLLLTGPFSSLSATNTTSSSCLPKKEYYSCGVVCVILRLAVLVKLRLVTDTDRQTQTQTDTDTDTSPWLVPRMHSIAR